MHIFTILASFIGIQLAANLGRKRDDRQSRSLTGLEGQGVKHLRQPWCSINSLFQERAAELLKFLFHCCKAKTQNKTKQNKTKQNPVHLAWLYWGRGKCISQWLDKLFNIPKGGTFSKSLKMEHNLFLIPQILTIDVFRPCLFALYDYCFD